MSTPTPTPSYDQPSLLFEMTEYIANNVCDFRFPDVTAHALRRATKRMAAVPRPPVLTFDGAMREMAARGDPHDADADAAFVQFATEACARCPWLRAEVLICAARHGCTPVCRAFAGKETTAPRHPSTLVFHAALGGNRETVEWARSAGFPWGFAFFAAARSGHADLVRWMYERVAQSVDDDNDFKILNLRLDIVRGAATGGHLALLQWTTSLGWPLDTAIYHAAVGGQVHVMRWVADSDNLPHHSGWMQKVIENAAIGGHVASLEWALQRGATLSAACVRHAALSGHLEAMQWMRDQGTVDIGVAYVIALLGGNLDVVRWMHGAGFAGDDTTQSTVLAANAGNLDLLRLLHSELGVPICRRECSQAVGSGVGPAVLRYLHDHGLLDVKECLLGARGWRRKAMVKWIAREVEGEGAAAAAAAEGVEEDVVSNVALDATMGRAAVGGDLPTVQWLHAEGFRLSEDAVRMAGGTVHKAVRKWLLANL